MARATRDSCRGDGAHGGRGHDLVGKYPVSIRSPCFSHSTQVVLLWSCPPLADPGNCSHKAISPKRDTKRVDGQVMVWPHKQWSDVGSADMEGMPVLVGRHERKWGSLGCLSPKDISSPFYSPYWILLNAESLYLQHDCPP